MASLLGVGGVWEDESPASLRTCQLIICVGRGRQMGTHRQSSSLKTVWRLKNWEGKVTRRIWRTIVSDTGAVQDVWERGCWTADPSSVPLVPLGFYNGDQSQALEELQHAGSSFLQARQTRSGRGGCSEVNLCETSEGGGKAQARG